MMGGEMVRIEENGEISSVILRDVGSIMCDQITCLKDCELVIGGLSF
jgi:hypothetical protein